MMRRIGIAGAVMMCGMTAAGATLAAPPHRDNRAPAAPVAAAGWSAAQCGREPAAPVVETATVERYNTSVDRVGAYEKEARAYNGCVARAATAEQTAISNEARLRIDRVQEVSSGVQKRIAANFVALTAALRASAPKLQNR